MRNKFTKEEKNVNSLISVSDLWHFCKENDLSFFINFQKI